jgi:hypothetical protein
MACGGLRGVAEHLSDDQGWSLEYELAQGGFPGGAAEEAEHDHPARCALSDRRS